MEGDGRDEAAVAMVRVAEQKAGWEAEGEVHGQRLSGVRQEREQRHCVAQEGGSEARSGAALRTPRLRAGGAGPATVMAFRCAAFTVP